MLRAGVAMVAGLAALGGSLSWSALALDREVASRAGLRLSYFDTPDFTGPPRIQQIVPAVDLTFLDADSTLPRRGFTARWEGQWEVRDASLDVFAGADDEVHVFVDGERVIERSAAKGMGTASRRLTLTPGFHALRVDYVQRAGEAHVNVQWAPADGPPRPIDPDTVFPEIPDRQVLFDSALASTRRRVASVVWRACGVAALGVLLVPVVRRQD